MYSFNELIHFLVFVSFLIQIIQKKRCEMRCNNSRICKATRQIDDMSRTMPKKIGGNFVRMSCHTVEDPFDWVKKKCESTNLRKCIYYYQYYITSKIQAAKRRTPSWTELALLVHRNRLASASCYIYVSREDSQSSSYNLCINVCNSVSV